MSFRLALAAGLTLASTAAFADDAGKCYGFTLDQDPSHTALYAVTGEGKANFLANVDEVAGCPAGGAKCSRRAFLLGGDKVLVSATENGFACADFVGPKGTETSGWLPADRLEPLSVAPAWLGRWKRDTSAQIEIKPGKDGRLAVSGEATWQGNADNVHTGEIDAAIDGTKPMASWSVSLDDDSQKPYEAAGEFDCKIRMAQLGPYLVVEDSGSCGGANVNFTGVYVKR